MTNPAVPATSWKVIRDNRPATRTWTSRGSVPWLCHLAAALGNGRCSDQGVGGQEEDLAEAAVAVAGQPTE